jgi:diguanylate cyclase (GGDEF)-like protein/PAS domain S-box-containing protein
MISTIWILPGLPWVSFSAMAGLSLAVIRHSRGSRGKKTAQDLLMQKLPHGVIVLDRQDRILESNPAAQKIIGASSRKLTGREVQKVIPSWEEWQPLLREKKGIAIVPSPFHPEATLEIQLWTMPGAPGKTSAHVILVRDVTNQIRLEADYKRSVSLLQDQSTEIETMRASIQEQAVRDPVTNLYNRCYLSETLARELARAARAKYPVSLMRISIDQFQEINKTYGYKAGVEALKIMGSLLSRHIRKGDVASRYGSEEFVVMMSGAPIAVTGARAELLRKAFQESILTFLGSLIHTTFSCGVAASPKDGTTPEELLQATANALEKSKSAGGNRVTVLE